MSTLIFVNIYFGGLELTWWRCLKEFQVYYQYNKFTLCKKKLLNNTFKVNANK